MKKIKPGFLLPSAACNINKKKIVYREMLDKKPEVGDLLYGSVKFLGLHKSLENKLGRIHTISDGSKAVFVYGNRYAPDVLEGFVPEDMPSEIPLLSRSGLVGQIAYKNTNVLDPTIIKIYGYVCTKKGEVLNTLSFKPSWTASDLTAPRKKGKMILCIGSSMNSGKSQTAGILCKALSNMGHTVSGTKVTGTASLKDILLMEDCGAESVSDFSYLGYPSTYMMPMKEIIPLFENLDFEYGTKSSYWVVEFADGIYERETRHLLKSGKIKKRIHRLVYCSNSAAGVIGGLSSLKKDFNLVPDAISGVCGSSPLMVREVQEHTDIPIFDNLIPNISLLSDVIL